jgi:hypothetical protein
MTNPVERARRALFEKWISETAPGFIHELDLARDGAGAYRYQPASMQWPAFNAALDSIVVELPPIEIGHVNDCGPSFDIGCAYNTGISECRSAIHAAGVKTK